MQQHSAQHLVSALFESMFSIPTVCWYALSSICCFPIVPLNVLLFLKCRSLGEQLSTIELGTARLSDGQLELVDRTANERIRDALPVKTLM